MLVLYALVSRLAALGPRVPGSAAHEAARDLLLEQLRGLGLAPVDTGTAPGAARNVEAVLRGAEPEAGEIVLAAHYDTVAESPGAADDAAGCAVVLAAVADLRRTPLRRTLRVVFFDGEEAGLEGSRAWAASLGPVERERILAALHLDVVGLDRNGPAVALDVVAAPDGPANSHAPGWLVHAAIEAGAAVGFPFRVGDPRVPLAAQVLTRTARVSWSSDVAAVHAAGIPSLLLTDFGVLHPYEAMHSPADRVDRLDAGRLESWATATQAVVRRLDALEGRPRPEDEFLALWGRVWVRRDLLWVGFGLWIVMVLHGRPGRWAGARTDERRARGRSYLPGYLFRLLFLVAAIWIPALAAPLLYPLAPLALVEARTTAARAALAAVACLPIVLWLGLLAAAGRLGWITGVALPPGQAALLVGTVAVFGWQLWSSPEPERRRLSSFSEEP